MGFQAVSVNYWAVMPILIVFGGALLGVLVEAFAARSVRHSIQLSHLRRCARRGRRWCW
jgi:NADH-quinone oxidoreductase subunit N